MPSAVTYNNAFVINCHTVPSKGLELDTLWVLLLPRVDCATFLDLWQVPAMFITQVIIWRKSECSDFTTFLLGLETSLPALSSERYRAFQSPWDKDPGQDLAPLSLHSFLTNGAEPYLCHLSFHIYNMSLNRIFFGSTGDWAQDLQLARQMLCYSSHTVNPFSVGYFWDRVLLYGQGGLDWDPLFCRMGSQEHTTMPSHWLRQGLELFCLG
jgi:hypothetical protein